jgi:hypothetical protein
MNGRDQKKTLGIEVVLLTPLKPQLFLEENTSKKKKKNFCVLHMIKCLKNTKKIILHSISI